MNVAYRKLITYAPGMRIVVRDAEWIVRRADPGTDGGYLIECEGLSELVRGKEGRFLTSIENDFAIGAKPIEILDPATTKLVEDRSSNYRGTLLYIESLLRQRVPTDENIHFGQQEKAVKLSLLLYFLMGLNITLIL
jgi:hypothetical protein